MPNTVKKANDFIARSIESNVPANCFLVVDTHADAHTGGLQWGGGVTTAVKTSPASQVIIKFCGENFLQAMRKSANAARQFTVPDRPSWYSDSPAFRGGWRGLFVASCSPAVRVRVGFGDLKKLVQRQGTSLGHAFADPNGNP